MELPQAPSISYPAYFSLFRVLCQVKLTDIFQGISVGLHEPRLVGDGVQPMAGPGGKNYKTQTISGESVHMTRILQGFYFDLPVSAWDVQEAVPYKLTTDH